MDIMKSKARREELDGEKTGNVNGKKRKGKEKEKFFINQVNLQRPINACNRFSGSTQL